MTESEIKTETGPKWEGWVKAVEKSFNNAESHINEALTQETPGLGLRLQAGERLSQDPINLAQEVLTRLPEAQEILVEFLREPSDKKAQNSQIGRDGRHLALAFFDSERSSLKREIIRFENTACSLILDPTGGELLPTVPEEARTQVLVRLEEVDDEVVKELWSKRRSLGVNEVKEGFRNRDPVRGLELAREARREQRKYDSVWKRALEFSIRRAHFHQRSGKVRFDELVGIRLETLLNNDTIIKLTNRTLVLRFEREIDEALGTDHLEERDLDLLAEKIYQVSETSATRGRRGRRGKGGRRRR